MSNHNAFDAEQLSLLLEPFAPGMSPHITPIKYEALTPDLFVFLFRTSGRDGRPHYFVSLEFDYLADLAAAYETISDWHGEVLQFLSPAGSTVSAEPELDELKATTREPYFALLAEVSQPTGKGYWASMVVIAPGDNIDEKLERFNEKQKVTIKKGLANILKQRTDPNASFLDTFAAKQQDQTVTGTNKTDMVVSVYMRPDGGVEFFYDYVNKRPLRGTKES